MAAKDGKGYLFPSPIDPEGLLCLKIFIPNDPRYLEAFSGQFHELGYWLSWAKDGTNNAALVAQIWKNAIDYTYQNGWVNSCGDCADCELCDMTKDELLELISEVLDMNIKVNCGGGCGCGCGCGSVPTNEPLPSDPPLGGAIPPVDSDELEPPLGNKCARANWMADQFKTTLLSGSTIDSREKMISLLVQQYGISLAIATALVPLAMFAVFVAYLANSAVGLIEDTFDEIREGIVCALFVATSEKRARQGVDAVIDAGTNPFARLVLRAVNQMIPYQLLFDSSITIPSSYSSMSCCGQSQNDFVNLPTDECGEYYLIVADAYTITPVGSPPNAQLDYSPASGAFAFTPLQLQQSSHIIHMDINFDVMTDDVFGFVVEFVERVYGDSNNGVEVNSFAGGINTIQTNTVYYSAALAGVDACYADFTLALSTALSGTRYNAWATTSPLTSGPKGKLSPKSTGSGAAAQTFEGRILIICKRP